jgi:type II secretory pathway pseudopilin PulG
MDDKSKLAAEIVKALGDAAPQRSDHAWLSFAVLVVVSLLLIALGAIAIRLLMEGSKQIREAFEKNQSHQERITNRFTDTVTSMAKECHRHQNETWSSVRQYQDSLAEIIKESAIASANNSKVLEMAADESRQTREVMSEVCRKLRSGASE